MLAIGRAAAMSGEDREPLNLGVGGQFLGVIVLSIVALAL